MKTNVTLLSSLRSRLLGLFLLVATGSMLMAGYIAYTNGRETIEANTQRFLLSVSELKQQQIRAWLQDNAWSMESLAQRPLVVEKTAALLAGSGGESTTMALTEDLLQEHLLPSMRRGGAFDSLAILDAETGVPIVATRDDLTRRTFADAAFFEYGRQDTYVQPITLSPRDGILIMRIVTPILDQDGDGQPVGVLMGTLSVSELTQILAFHADVWETEDTYLVGKGYRLITRPRFEQGSLYGRVVETESTTACFAEGAGHGTYPDYRGNTVVGVYELMPVLDVCVLTELDQAEAFLPIATLQRGLVSAGVATILGGAVLAAITGRSITGPLKRIAVGAQAIGRGELDHRIDLNRRDELGLLAGSFDAMAADLQSSLEEARHGRRLLGQLYQAAEAVQRADDRNRVYQALGEGIAELGYNAVVLSRSTDENHYEIVHIALGSGHDAIADRSSDLALGDYDVNLTDVALYQQVIESGEAALISNPLVLLQDAAPGLAEALAAETADGIGRHRRIIAPMASSSGGVGILEVTGPGLAEADVPAIATFAQQAAIALEKAHLYDEVQAYAEDLESRVAERTEELNDARLAALNMMADANLARQEAEQIALELRREAGERIQAQQELQRSNKELEQFAYIASHDLQEPLRKVQAFGDRLMSRYGEKLPTRGQDYLERMMGAAERGQRMVNDLLSYSRVATRARPFERVDVQALAEAVIDDLEIMIERRDGRVVAANLPTIDADRSQLRQVLSNLISNGLKFQKDGAPPQIEVRGTVLNGEGEGWCEIRVEDNGIGFDTRYLERILQPFQRLHGRSEYEGSGIGLAICKKIVDRHGGTISAESEPGAGATFILTLPLAQDDTEPDR